MRYFITGGAGFIGANFIEQLLNADELPVDSITVYDKLTYAGTLKNLEQACKDSRTNVLIADICDRDELVDRMINHDIVVHFAAESHVDRSINSATPFVQTNEMGTLNVLEAAKANGVKTVIHISTDEVYGSLKSGAADESYPLLPNSPYAASKAASDLIARSFFQTHGLDVRTTRCSNNYGKYQYPEKFIPVAINSILQKKKIPLYGNGQNLREWIHVTDHCKAILEVIKHGSAGEIYNIGSGLHLSNLELVQKLLEILKVDKTWISYVEDRRGHDFRYSVNSNKIDKISNFERVPFERGLEEVVEWYSENSEWWGSKS